MRQPLYTEQHNPFRHPKDVIVGQARILWDDRELGWRIPGGALTRNQFQAQHAAEQIDRMLREAA